jgi:hypothetical protein
MKLLFPLLSILFFSFCSCSSTNEFNRKSNQKAKDLMSLHLNNINIYVGNDSAKELISDIKESVELYESISLVKSHREYQMEEFVMPLRFNISDWTEFYNLNKDNVYLDKNKVIKFKNASIYLEKNPVDYLNSFVNDLDKMIFEKNLRAQEFDYIIEKLEVVTKLECNDNKFDLEDLNKCVFAWKNWINENSSKLYWNKGTQEVIAKY